MMRLEELFKHDNSIDEITLDVESKTIKFVISNFIEKIDDYESWIITFNDIGNIYFSSFNFIEHKTEYGWDILTFNLNRLNKSLYSFNLLLSPGFSKQDVSISFDFYYHKLDIIKN